MSRTVYLDHAATTPMVPAALEAMTRQLAVVGNPSSLHASGRRARRIVEEAREQIAAAIGCRPGEIVFTSGGTEADNLAIKGITWARQASEPDRRLVLASSVEHHAVLDPLQWLVEAGEADLELLAVQDDGRLDVERFAAVLERDPDAVALVSVMWANNESGAVQPLAEVVRLAHEHGIPVHSDAVQALGVLPLDVTASGLDAVTVTGHKVGGPVGVGALVVRREVGVTPLLHGGGQERDLRSGTLDVPAIAGFAAAVEQAVTHQVAHAARLADLRAQLVDGLRAAVPDVVVNGPAEPFAADGSPLRLPGVVHASFPGCEGDSLLMLLDARGIECSTGSACSAGVPQASHVLLAMGREDDEARSSLRFSLGHTSTADDVAAVVAAIAPCVERARAARA